MTQTTAPPTPDVAWHTMRATARRLADAHPLALTSADLPPDGPIPMPGDREKRRAHWRALAHRLTVLEMTHAVLALNMASRTRARVLADAWEREAAAGHVLAPIVAELAAAVRAFAGEAPTDG